MRPYTGRMPNILVIENDVPSVETITKYLTSLGATLTFSKEGAEGLGLARESQFDLILLSVELPKVSGYSVCNKLKKEPRLAGIPLILMSSEATIETFAQHRTLKTHAEGYLHKPLAPDALLMAVKANLPELNDSDADFASTNPDGLEMVLEVLEEVETVAEFVEGRGAGVSLGESSFGADEELLDEEVLGSLDVLDAMENGGDWNGDQEGSLEENSEGIVKSASMSSPGNFEDTAAMAVMGDRAPKPASDSLAATMRREVKELRDKVRRLEEVLEEKELEFSERLLQESTRAREAIEDRQKASHLEHQLEKAKAALLESEAGLEGKTNEISALRESMLEGQSREERLSATISHLEQELNQVQSAKQDGDARIVELKRELEELNGHLVDGDTKRRQAQEIISSTVEMLDGIRQQSYPAD